MSRWVEVLLGTVVVLAAGWLALVAVLWRLRPNALTAREAIRFVPDVARLARRLAKDPTMPPNLRIRLWLLLGYLIMPIDLIPDIIPVIGYADDVIIVILVLRSVLRVAGREAIERHWSGSPDGLFAVLRLVGAAGGDDPDDG